MLFGLIALVGLFFGIFLAYFVKEEIKAGIKYFNLLEILVLSILIVLVPLYYKFEVFSLIVGLIAGFIIRREYLYFGVGIVASVVSKNVNFLYSALVFFYGMPYGSILTYEKKLDKLYLDCLLFLLPIVLYFLDYNLIYFATGGLISVLILKTAKLIKFK